MRRRTVFIAHYVRFTPLENVAPSRANYLVYDHPFASVQQCEELN